MTETTPAKQRRSLIIVMCSTLVIAMAQALIKSGTAELPAGSLLDTAIGILTTPKLFSGYALYGLVTVMMVLALRHAELSIIYPVIALSYVWVSILSVVVFHEVMNGFKLAGVVVIISGVAVLGIGQRQT